MVATPEIKPRFAEFFCGGGMVRAGLSGRWSCGFANDIDAMKCAVYRDNWGDEVLVPGDIAQVSVEALLQPIDLYWASSPCQDFSLAGKGLGLSGARSGTFHEWIRLVREAASQGFAPRILAFENVTGLLSRDQGRDMLRVLSEMVALGYRVGALEIDASVFVPQSRPRLFVIAARSDYALDALAAKTPDGVFHSARIRRLHDRLPKKLRDNWIWWKHGAPQGARVTLADLVDDTPDTPWFDRQKVAHLMAMMSEPSLARIKQMRASGAGAVGTIYRRGRPDETGKLRQRAELRFDGLAGCLRTPGGGSSRQTILFADGKKIRARLLSSREVARLMGLPDSYRMPGRYNQAYQVAGDGVVVPIIEYLDREIFQKVLVADRRRAVA